MRMTIKEIDQGFCRVLFELKVAKEENAYSVWYCIQEDFKDTCNLYRCGVGPYYEPEYTVEFVEGTLVEVELPKGDTDLEKAVRRFIEGNKTLVGVKQGEQNA